MTAVSSETYSSLKGINQVRLYHSYLDGKLTPVGTPIEFGRASKLSKDASVRPGKKICEEVKRVEMEYFINDLLSLGFVPTSIKVNDFTDNIEKGRTHKSAYRLETVFERGGERAAIPDEIFSAYRENFVGERGWFWDVTVYRNFQNAFSPDNCSVNCGGNRLPKADDHGDSFYDLRINEREEIEFGVDDERE